MSRARRIETVVRIRGLQARIAETEAARARGEVDRCQDAVDRAIDDLAARSDPAEVPIVGVETLRRRQEILQSAVETIGLRRELHAQADVEFDDARGVWLDAHRRHEAIERLHDRTVADELVERGRLEQLDIDELVTVRHGRNNAARSEEER